MMTLFRISSPQYYPPRLPLAQTRAKSVTFLLNLFTYKMPYPFTFSDGGWNNAAQPHVHNLHTTMFPYMVMKT